MNPSENQTAQKFHIPDGEISLFDSFFNNTISEFYFKVLQREINWEQHRISLFGKSILEPRLTAFYGRPGVSYKYSGKVMQSQKLTNELIEIQESIERFSKTNFNSILLNYYRSGNDSMGWHSDDESCLGKNPTIASISLGSTRKMHFKHKTLKNQKVNITLNNGSLLLMSGSLQHQWKHQIPKSKRIFLPRINLTFRKIYISS